MADTGARPCAELLGRPLVLIEDRRPRSGLGSRSADTRALASGRVSAAAAAAGPPPARGRADQRADGRPALLVSVFVPKGDSVPGESGEPAHWREP
ncbi:hypothetical protein ACIRQQ_24300 [Streptomyces fuscichromogenes]|uniref:hypothetical protein n=1 Tax=Streptomyces fuscichromogenes TaxID=1324013 RepID=UPI0037F20953